MLRELDAKYTFCADGGSKQIAAGGRRVGCTPKDSLIPLQAVYYGHDLVGKPAHADQDVAVWYQATRVEPADELIHPALRMYLPDLADAGLRRAIERHRLDLFPRDLLHPLA